MQKSILVVENDPNLCASLVTHCNKRNFSVSTAGSVTSAYQKLNSGRFDLAIIDRGLDDGDGIEIIEYLHDYNPDTRILMCSRLGDSTDRIHSLSCGADSCLVKPFSFMELSLKIDRLLSLERSQVGDVLSAGKLSLNNTSGIVTIDGHTFRLRKKEAEVLSCLLKYKNQVVSRETLISAVWGMIDDTPEFGTLDVYVRRIRMRLRTFGHLIKTIRGYGYQVSG